MIYELSNHIKDQRHSPLVHFPFNSQLLSRGGESKSGFTPSPVRVPLLRSTGNSNPRQSVLVVRDASVPGNLSGGKETLVPERLLYGLIPQCLLDAYRFWRDETTPATSLGMKIPLNPELYGHLIATSHEDLDESALIPAIDPDPI